MSQYYINGHKLSRTDPLFDESLAESYKIRERPLCLCMNPGVPMYITRNGNKGYIVKRMPNGGQDHNPDCDSYEIPAELSGKGAVVNKAISEDHETGNTNLKLDFPLTKLTVNRNVSNGEAHEASEVKADATKLTIRSLLHYLYEDAGLNKWTPKMEGKRSWFVIQKYLSQSSQNKTTRKQPLESSLLIPELFSVEKKDEIITRRRKFLATLKKQGSKQPMGVIIGEVKNIEQARFGHKMLLKHMPDTPVFLGDDVYKRINKTFSTELAFFYENESIHLLTICTFFLSASGSPQVDTISFMTVDRNWLPFETIEELELLERLCSSRRHFIKGLRYNLNSSSIIATVLLTDTEKNPTAVYLVPAGSSEDYYDEVAKIVAQSNILSKIIDLNQEESISI